MPTPEEAATIALTNNHKATELLKPLIIKLAITNIRIMKKIESLAIRLIELLANYDASIVEQAIATLALARWSVLDRSRAPSIEFLRSYNKTGIFMRAGREALDSETARLHEMISDYPFNHANELDQIIIDGAEAGYFQEEELKKAADRIADEQKAYNPDNDFTRTWQQLYHGLLIVDDTKFLDELHRSAIKEAASIDLININAAICMLRENERHNEADEVIQVYIEAKKAKGFNFFNIDDHVWMGQKPDEGLHKALSEQKEKHIDSRNPLDVLRYDIARQVLEDADFMLMAKQSVSDFEEMFEALNGKEVKPSIKGIVAMGQSHHELSEEIARKSMEALQRIAHKSVLTARKISSFGIKLE